MDITQRQWTVGVAAVTGCLILVIGCTMAATAVGSKPVASVPGRMEMATKITPITCASELYAFIKVAEAARDLGPDRAILNFSLDDLQASLADCLRDNDKADRRDATDQTMAPHRLFFRDV